MLRRTVAAVQVIAMLAVAAFVVLLFANEPGDAPAAPAGRATGDAAVATGARVFADRCAGCHGPRGDGGIGPRLSGGAVVERFPDAARQEAFVSAGAPGMPAFGRSLSAEQIAAVVAYTREAL